MFTGIVQKREKMKVKKLTGNELEELLASRNSKKYIYLLHMLRNAGKPGIAVTEINGYCIDKDIVIVIKYIFDGSQFYFEVSDHDRLKYFYNKLKDIMKSSDSVMLSSDDENLFDDIEFIKLFGRHSVWKTEQYGMFGFEKDHIQDTHIRILTSEDEGRINSFREPFVRYRNNLKNAYETCIKLKNEDCKIFGYIDDSGNILGYLIADTADGEYWDIDYVYVSENARRKGIAKKLAVYYASEIISGGGFPSYGTPENAASEKVALSAGFELFERRYNTSWVPAECF